MKQVTQDETDLLFEWVKNWYPTPETPKIAILLLNEKEWREIYEKSRRVKKEERERKISEFVKDKHELKQLAERIDDLTEEQRRELVTKIAPHEIVKEIDNIDYWMNEVSGECFSIEELKGYAEILRVEIDDFFKPYLAADFVIIVSAFFNEQQRKILQTEKERKFVLHNAIFHELIHVIEHCNQELIFKTNNVSENNKITMHITREYFS